MVIDTRHATSRSDARANRARLLDAAHAVFAESGPDAEMKTIAERAGVGVGTIYRNFATKDDLLGALVNDAAERLELELDEVVALDDPLAALHGLVAKIWDMLDDYGALWQAMQDGTLPPDCIDGERDERVRCRVASVFERGASQGVFTSALTPREMTVMLKSFIFAYKDLSVALDPESARAACTHFLLHGFLPTPGESQT
ncbi:MAG TPA: TetR/AcrR family transcriptional regulator [Tepidiformaceae bacterium]|nr:TetR/AcrR family transcriptional regulator [Tepidiformaceae bacterium]